KDVRPLRIDHAAFARHVVIAARIQDGDFPIRPPDLRRVSEHHNPVGTDGRKFECGIGRISVSEKPGMTLQDVSVWRETSLVVWLQGFLVSHVERYSKCNRPSSITSRSYMSPVLPSTRSEPLLAGSVIATGLAMHSISR